MTFISKGKGHPITFLCSHKGEAEIQVIPIIHLVLERYMWSVPQSGFFILGYHTAFCMRLGVGVHRTFLDVSENLAPTGIL